MYIILMYYIDIYILYLDIHNLLTYKDFITFLRCSNIVLYSY